MNQRVIKVYFLKGTAKWCKHQKADEKYHKWSVDLYLDDDSWKKFAESGSQLKVRENEDGKYIALSRATTKLIKGEAVIIDPPKLFDNEGNEITETLLIGNGSTVTCKISVRDTPNGVGTTWEAIQINDLVEYTPAKVIVDTDVDVPF